MEVNLKIQSKMKILMKIALVKKLKLFKIQNMKINY